MQWEKKPQIQGSVTHNLPGLYKGSFMQVSKKNQTISGVQKLLFYEEL